jgi:hypothetical protein
MTMKKNTDGVNYPKALASKIMDKVVNSLSTSYMGTVIKVTPPKVSVQPIALTSDNKKQGSVDSAWVGIPAIKIKDHYGDDGTPFKWITPKVDIKVGDKVAVLVFDHDTEYYTGSDSMRVSKQDAHSVNDSFVICKIAEAGDFA